MPKPHGYQVQIEERIRKELSAGLTTAGVFKSVSANSNASDYEVEVRIRKIRIVSPGGRVFFGFLAGRSYVQVDVDVRQKPTNGLITSFQTTGYGAKTAIGKQSYGYDDPVREIVAHIISKLR